MDLEPFLPVIWAIVALVALALLIWGAIVFFIALTVRKGLRTVSREVNRFERFGDQPRRMSGRR